MKNLLTLILVVLAASAVIAQPSAPTALQPTNVTPTSFTVAWAAAPGSAGYRLDVSTNSSFNSYVSGFQNVTTNGTNTSYLVSGSITAGTTYYYRVRSVNSTGTSTNSNVITIITVPVIPSATPASLITTTGFTANWNSVTTATQYHIQYSQSSTFDTYSTITASGTSYAFTGLTPGIQYYYRVAAENAGGVSSFSSAFSATTISAVPVAPVATSATSVTGSSFTATWQAVPNATEYRLDVSLSPSFTSYVSSYQDALTYESSTTYPIYSNIVSGMVYYYRVRAKNGSVTSENSNVVTVTMPPAIPVANAASNVTSSAFSANWSAATGATSYSVQYSTSSSFTSPVTQTTVNTNYTFSGLASGVYYYRVAAVNASGTSSYSNTVATNGSAPPIAPVATAATLPNSGSFYTNWQSISGVTGYRLDVSLDPLFQSFVSGWQNMQISGGSSSSLPVYGSGITGGNTYYYRLRAVNASGTSASSAVISVTLTPSGPQSLSAQEITNNSFRAIWQPSTGATSYTLQYSGSSSFSNPITINTTNTSAVVTGLNANTPYYYRVSATNATGTSVYSATISTGTALPNPTTALPAGSIAQQSFVAKWTTVPNAANSRIDVSLSPNFEVNLPPYDNKLVSEISGYTAVQAPIQNLSSGTTYYYRVRSINAYGATISSNVITVTTLQLPPQPLPADNFTATSLRANWNEVATATEYYLDVSLNSAFSSFVTGYQNLTVTGLSQEVSGLTSNTIYYYRVRSNASAAVNSTVATTLTLFGAPTGLKGKGRETSIDAEWKPLAGASSSNYRIDVSDTIDFSRMVGVYYNFRTIDLDGADSRSATVTGLQPGKYYYYRIRANNASGPSANSNVAAVTTKLTAPTTVAPVTIGQTSFIALWHKSNGAINYRIDVSASSTFATMLTGYNNLLVPPSDTSLLITGLSINQLYYYRIRAVNESGPSSASEGRSVMTLPNPAPTFNVLTNATTTSFDASWVAVAGATNYQIDVSTSPEFTTYVSPYNNLNANNLVNYTTTAGKITGLLPGTSYYCRLRYTTASGGSTNSVVRSITTLTAVPNTFASQILDVSFQVNWSEGTAAILSYDIHVSTDSLFSGTYENFNVPGTLRSLLIAGRNPVTKYYFRVRANATTGSTSFSTPIRVKTMLIAPPSLKTSSSASASELFLIWEPVPNATIYLIDISELENFSNYTSGYVNFNASQLREYTGKSGTVLNGLTAGKTYFVRMRAQSSLGSSGYSNVLRLVMQGDRHYIKTSTPLIANLKTNSDLINAPVQTVQIKYDFYDNLARHLQTVSKAMSPEGRDIVTLIKYDEFGRQVFNYLPYEDPKESSGWYKHGVIAEETQDEFYQFTDGVARGGSPYSKTVFESSPLNRVVKQGSPGNVWQPNIDPSYEASDRSVRTAYEFNDAQEVLKWTYIQPASGSTALLGLVDAGTTANPAYYGLATLTKTKTKDPDNNELIEYTDKDGRIIARKLWLNALEYAETNYVYDIFGNLVCVIPPEAMKRVRQPSSEYFGKNVAQKEAFLKTWAFRYKYDSRNRVIQKQTPGTGQVYMVYDGRDRVILAQDSVQRSQRKWTFSKYDAHNRVVMTGIYVHPISISQQVMSGLISSTFDEKYDQTKPYAYTTDIFPQNNLTVLVTNFYDSYQFVTDGLTGNGFNFQSEHLEGQKPEKFPRVKNLITGQRINILGSNQNLWTVTYYDDNSRVLQTLSQNQLGGINIQTNIYNFSGGITASKTTHQTTDLTMDVRRRFDYDHGLRLINTWHKINDHDEVLLIKNQYNAISQIITRKLHSVNQGTTFTNDTELRYNIQGWLESINDSDLVQNKLLSLRLRYNENSVDVSKRRYNGNISQLTWKVAGGDRSIYEYTYDGMDRMVSAIYRNVSRPFENNRYNEIIADGENSGYDLNGNIRKLQRNGNKGMGVFDELDKLTYTYDGNRVISINDEITTLQEQEGFKELTSDNNEYAYNGNGSMISDANKGITKIEYNELNLPRLVVKEADSVVYTYTALGQKLRQQVYGMNPKTTDYVDEYIYENDTLRFFNHEEGRIMPDTLTEGNRPWEYQYHLKDHLGNVRLTFSEKSNTTEYATSLEETIDNEFENYNNRSGFSLGVRTGVQSQKLTGGNNSQIGLAKSFEVNAGDAFDLEVYAKYEVFDEEGTATNLNTLITALTGAFSLNPSGGIGLEGQAAYNAFNGHFGSGSLVDPSDIEVDEPPRAFLNYLLFNENFVLVDAGFDQVSTNAEQVGVSPNVLHDYLSLHVKIKQKGYLYVYLSNENPVLANVYFDDFKIVHHTGVEQSDDYYPFGLNFNSFRKEETLKNLYLYNSKELQDEIDLNWIDYGARMYDPTTSRWMATDPLSDLSRRWSPYTYCYNNPLIFVDPDGMFGDYYAKDGTHIGSDGKSDDRAYIVSNYDKSQTQTHSDGKTTTVVMAKDVHELKDKNGNAVSNSTLMTLAAASYGESGVGNVKEEMFGISSAIVNNNEARAENGNSETVIETATKIANALTDGNYRTADFNSASANDRNSNAGMKTAVAGAINAATGGTDYSNGATGWDGDDLPINSHRFGLNVSDASHDIYKVGDRPLSKPQSGASYKRQTTAAHGGTVFMKIHPDWVKTGAPRY